MKTPFRLRLRSWTVNGLLFLASALITVAIAEVAVRVLAPQQRIIWDSSYWMDDDSLGWSARPGARASFNTGERTVTALSDHEGFRVARAGRVEAPTEVLLVGDSFVEAIQVEFEESTAGVLEATLRSPAGGPVAVRNAGVSAWDPRQYLARIRGHFREDTADAVVVVLYLGNDLVFPGGPLPEREVVSRHAFRVPRSLDFEELRDGIFYPVNDLLETRSHLFVLLRRKTRVFLMRVGLTPFWMPPGFHVAEAGSPIFEYTTDLARRMRGAACDRGAPSLFVIVPAAFQVDTLLWSQYTEGFDVERSEYDLDQPNRILAAAFEEAGLRYVDATARLREAFREGSRPYGRTDPHFSPDGHRLLAELLRPHVEELLATTCDASVLSGEARRELRRSGRSPASGSTLASRGEPGVDRPRSPA